MDISKRQYVLSCFEISVQNMDKYKLETGYFLYVGMGLKKRNLTDINGQNYILLGEPFCVDVYGKKIESDIETFTGKPEEVGEATKYWTGKWILISKEGLIRDACGLMGAFFGYYNDEFVISSSLALLSKILSIEPSRTVASSGLNWVLLPNTILNGVNAPLCTE